MQRVLGLLRRFSWLERFVIIWVVFFPFVVAFASLRPFGEDNIFWVLVLYYVVGALAGIAVLVRRERRRVLLAQGEVAEVVEQVGQEGLMGDTRPDWAPTGSDFLDQKRFAKVITARFRDHVFLQGARTRSVELREPLAFRASGGQFDYERLADLFDPSVWPEKEARMMLAEMDRGALYILGRLLSTQAVFERDRYIASRIFIYLASLPSFDEQPVASRVYAAERIILAGDLRPAVPIVAGLVGAGLSASLLRADLLNPFGAERLQENEEIWLSAFNAIYVTQGFEPVTLSDEGETPFDRLSPAVLPGVAGGPMVSIIMTCFKPDHTLISAARSVVAQTWQNWELIVADDASPEEFHPILDEVEALDPRIRTIRATDNGGTYVRRNESIIAARGEFITMHDSDDWAHPRRLEVQVRHLIQNPDELASIGQSVRVSEHLSFVQPRRAILRLSEPSLMFRKEPVIERIGYFDSVRKGADTEFRLRLEQAFGRPVPLVPTDAPLFLMRFLSGSLSGEEFRDGWMHPGRSAYRTARIDWHTEIGKGAASPYLPFPLETRPFQAPRSFLGLKDVTEHFDVIVVFDGRIEVGGHKHIPGLVDEMRALVARGLTVGFVHVESLAYERSQASLDHSLHKIINEGTVVHVLLDEVATADTIVIRTCSAMQSPPSVPARIRAPRVVIVQDKDFDASGSTFVKSTVERETRRVFEAEPEWVQAESPMDYSLLDTGRSKD